MIQFACPGCDKPLRVDDSLAGKQVKCLTCGQHVLVPDQSKSIVSHSPPGPWDDGFFDDDETPGADVPKIPIGTGIEETPEDIAKRMGGGHLNAAKGKTTKNNAAEKVVAAGCLGVVAVFVLMCAGVIPTGREKPGGPVEEKPSRVRIGQEGLLYAETDGTHVAVAVSVDAYNEMLAAGSDRVLAVMTLNGSVFPVQQGTRVQVLPADTSLLTGDPWGSSKVLILDGPTVGRRGYVPSEFVTHPSEVR